MRTDVLLSIRKLTKHFPLPKKHLFAREKKYLRANDGIDLEIHKGESFGLVGEIYLWQSAVESLSCDVRRGDLLW